MAGPNVLILGSAPNATEAATWPRTAFDHIVVINNAWRIRPDWSHLIHPEDFPDDRHPPVIAPGQAVIRADDYVPIQNTMGGFVYAGGTMAFTAAYWALGVLRPATLCFMGCDMVYVPDTATHFYGVGAADPLRDDVSLRSLPAKARRFEVFAAERGCAVVNLSRADSVLPYRRASLDQCAGGFPMPAYDAERVAEVRAAEAAAGYIEPSGRYWQRMADFDPAVIDRIDAGWLAAFPT